ncbi:unnamed protein product [Caenorhabditis angaria]|uniref:Uncharacterized protein n=1 Tax=Caenorhabditis angaria TaxID=860376 RepID=A0A9P1MU76_9PELO|nr:unnamed protein product [Caenorhabditis angaria]
MNTQADDIISVFNDFFKKLPENRSYDLTFKVYLQELADIDDKSINSTHEMNRVTISSFGSIHSNLPDNIQKTTISTSKTDTTIKTESSKNSDKYEELEPLKKPRSLVNLLELNKEIGIEIPDKVPSKRKQESKTEYENLDTLNTTIPKYSTSKSSQATSAPSFMASYSRSASNTSTFTKTSNSSTLGINHDGWYIISSKPLKISNELKIDLKDLF